MSECPILLASLSIILRRNVFNFLSSLQLAFNQNHLENVPEATQKDGTVDIRKEEEEKKGNEWMNGKMKIKMEKNDRKHVETQSLLK